MPLEIQSFSKSWFSFVSAIPQSPPPAPESLPAPCLLARSERSFSSGVSMLTFDCLVSSLNSSSFALINVSILSVLFACHSLIKS